MLESWHRGVEMLSVSSHQPQDSYMLCVSKREALLVVRTMKTSCQACLSSTRDQIMQCAGTPFSADSKNMQGILAVH